MKEKRYDVIVVGGGASGIMAAIFAALSGHKVLVLEQKDKLCKKIYATGNGKCNFTNRDWNPSCFRGINPELAKPVLDAFSLADTLEFFHAIGVYPKEKNGYFYPSSEQAASVAECLSREADRLGVTCIVGCRVKNVSKGSDGLFYADTEQGTFYGKNMVLATGGKASPVHGSDGSGYPFAKGFGHSVIPPLPAIVQLKAEGKYFKTLSGVRTEGRITLYAEDKSYSEEGELLFAAYGISGIPVMQVSRYASVALSKRKKVTVELDLFPVLSEAELQNEIEMRFRNGRNITAEEALGGLCNHKLNYVILMLCGIEPTASVRNLSKKDASKVADKIKHFIMKITDTNGFEQAQACAGGVPLTELKETMESKLVTGLYITGELADIDGTCGGYNLQWAWSSGAAAGRSIGGDYASHSTVKTGH